MGEVVPARTSPTLHPPSPPTVHELSQLALKELSVSAWKNGVDGSNRVLRHDAIIQYSLYMYRLHAIKKNWKGVCFFLP